MNSHITCPECGDAVHVATCLCERCGLVFDVALLLRTYRPGQDPDYPYEIVRTTKYT